MIIIVNKLKIVVEKVRILIQPKTNDKAIIFIASNPDTRWVGYKIRGNPSELR